MKVVLVEYNAGNVQSVVFALKRLGVEAKVSGDHSEIQSADKVIIPGVGEASSAMRFLRARGLSQLIPTLKQPVLGICLGLQILCSYSEENDTECLGVFPERISKMKANSGTKLKIPHMGWNSLSLLKGKLFHGLAESSYVYFVHSFCALVGKDTSAVCDYGGTFSAALEKDNFYALQFHPEKSADTGQKILKNFISI